MLARMRNALLPLLGLSLIACGSDGPQSMTGQGTQSGTSPSMSTTDDAAGTGSTSGSEGTSTSVATTTTPVDTSTTTADPSTGAVPPFDVGNGETGGPSCVPVSDEEQSCDGIDDDCNGFVDDIDAGGDGICDCLAIGIIGTSGGLASSQFQQWLIDRGSSAERIDPALIDATVLADYDVVILDQLTREYTAAEATAFDTWVSAGGGLMSMTGHTASPVSAQQWPNTVLGPMGLTYQGPLLNGPVTDFELHPVSVGLTSVTFLGGFEVVADNPVANDVIGRLPGGAVAGMAQERALGKILVWGDEWIEYDSEWESLPEITQLWVNIFEWITPVSLCTPPPG